MNFCIILTQFYINFSRQEHQIDVLYVSFNVWVSQVSSYTPFHFSFTVPRFVELTLQKIAQECQVHLSEYLIWVPIPALSMSGT